MTDLTGDAKKLFEAVLAIEEKFGYEETNANSRRINEIRAAVDEIVGKGGEGETVEN